MNQYSSFCSAFTSYSYHLQPVSFQDLTVHPRTYSSGSSVEVGSHHARTVSVASSDVVDRTQASPLLVHSTKKTKGEQLKR